MFDNFSGGDPLCIVTSISPSLDACSPRIVVAHRPLDFQQPASGYCRGDISVIFRTDHLRTCFFSRSRHLSLAESPKSVLTLIRVPNTIKDRLAVLSAEARMVRGTGPDGPRAGAGATPPLCTSRQSAPGSRTVHDGTKILLLRSRPRSHLPRGTLSGGEIVGCVLASTGHPRCL
jgi:hypothetical protein